VPSRASGTTAAAPGSTGAPHLRWQDMSGKVLFTRHVYENEYDLETEA